MKNSAIFFFVKAVLSGERRFFSILIISAYVVTLALGFFYFLNGVTLIVNVAAIAFTLFIVYGVASLFVARLVWLFRLTILTIHSAFFIHAYFTGGIFSMAVAELLITPILAFFYRPLLDRYIFMIVSLVSIISMWILTFYDKTSNLIVNPEILSINNLIIICFVWAVLMVYTIFYREALARKNKKLGDSIKEIKMTTQKLIQSEKMASLGLLSAGVAHEINNPLNFIKGGVEGLVHKMNRESDDNEEIMPFINAISDGVARATAIVNSLGHFSRQSKNMDEDCNLHTILENCLVILGYRFKDQIEVIKDYEPQNLIIKGNEGKLHQAYLNIINNALQAIKDKGRLTLQTRKDKDDLVVRIIDTGEGISEENISKISDPFFTTKPVGEGTGLGLPISYKIIQEHNGQINVDSKVGEGTTFEVRFNSNTNALSV